jgi:hypothetical protein
MAMRRYLFAVFAVALAGCAEESSAEDSEAGSSDETVSSGVSASAAPLTFSLPKKGAPLTRSAPADLGCRVRLETRRYQFPAGATDTAVSKTGKSMCFALGAVVHCHVSGTSTGFCADELNNVVNAVLNPTTEDGDFVSAYVKAHPQHKANLSGHSQGAYDVSRAASLLGPGDQLMLLQPAAASLTPNDVLAGAARRGARVYIAWSPNDNTAIGIRLRAGRLPLIEFPMQEGIRVHNAPNARHLFLDHFNIPAGRTVSPALDASIISNPGSPRGPWRFPSWAE